MAKRIRLKSMQLVSHLAIPIARSHIHLEYEIHPTSSRNIACSSLHKCDANDRAAIRRAKPKSLQMRREVRSELSEHSDCSLLIHSITDRQIPSVLSYIDGEEYHGTQAKSQLVRNGNNTVAYFRDYLGKE